jgi:hypothetical protein
LWWQRCGDCLAFLVETLEKTICLALFFEE